MFGEGIFYFVFKVYVDGIKQVRSLFLFINFDYGIEGSLCESLKEDNIVLRILIRLGVEFCEIFMEIYVVGFFVGIFWVDFFSLDVYCYF